jgi:hypothetical protein
MSAVLAEEAAAIGTKVFDCNLRRSRSHRDGLSGHLSINHHRNVGHQHVAVGIFLNDVGYHRSAIGHHRLTFGIQLLLRHGDCNVGHDGLTFIVGFLNLSSVRFHQVGAGVGLEILHDTLGA